MRRLTLVVWLCFVAFSPAWAVYHPVAMGSLHCNTSQGYALTLGDSVSVTGIVTAGTATFTPAKTDIYIQDATGAANVYYATPITTFAIGDSFTVNGIIIQYRGMNEIDPRGYTKHAANRPVPAPRVLTCYQVAHQFGSNYCEPEEAMLIKLQRVTYTGTWASGQVVTLHDESGTCDMYIDVDTGVQNITPPAGYFDLVGVLKQFAGFSPPFNTGYEVLPRSAADVIPISGPALLAGPEETDVLPTQVTIRWTTDQATDSRVDFGYSTSYELGSVYDPTMTTNHAVTLTGLEPARIHVYRVTSVNQFGSIGRPGMRFCSGSRSSGETRVYFNKGVDTSLALGEPANGNTDLPSVLIQRINYAQTSIDVAIYSFSISSPTDALIAAHNRGVQVRFITENDNFSNTEVQRLVAAGIPVIDDSYGPNNSGGGLMHDKFWIFDKKDTNPSNDWVLTGSWNLSNAGTYSDTQNVILIQDESLATIYTAEFEEMWGSSTVTPDPNVSRFGAIKLDDTPKKVWIAGHPAQVYFSPSDGSMDKIAARCREAEYSAHFCINVWTYYAIENALKARYDTIPGFLVRGVFDTDASNQTIYIEMRGGGSYPWSPPADVWYDTEPGMLHSKYMILDVNRNVGRPTVITGSPNWSNAANNDNDENTLMVEDFRVANLYYQDFAVRYHSAGGTGDLAAGAPEAVQTLPDGLTLLRNPSDGGVALRLAPRAAGTVRLALHDIGGRRVATRDVRVGGSGTQDVDWRLPDLGPGVYFLRASGAGIDGEERVTVVR
jgi:phosphatidylserine/phosphatidylglycerophosphate/cardiolipin synthase-like enzyme